MIVLCQDCGATYNDVWHYRTCPHEWFPMSESVVKQYPELAIPCPCPLVEQHPVA